MSKKNVIKWFMLILLNLVNADLRGQDIILVKHHNDSVINRYLELEFSQKCREGLKFKRSSKREKKDQRCLSAFFDLHHYLQINIYKNDAQNIFNYISEKKYRFVNARINEDKINIDINGGNYYLEFMIDTKERKIIGGFGDNLMNIFCNNYSFMDYLYIRDIMMKYFPFKISVVDQDVWLFSGTY